MPDKFVVISDETADNDEVESPAHYQGDGVETIEIIRLASTDAEYRGHCVGCVMKYLLRYKHKHSQPSKQIQCLRKAIKYIQFLIEDIELESFRKRGE